MLNSTIRKLAVTAALATIALPMEALARVSVAVTNNTGYTITQLWIDGAQLPQYTVERLNGRTIENGRRSEFGVEEDSTCYYDLFARDTNGTEYTFRFYQCGSGGVTID